MNLRKKHVQHFWNIWLLLLIFTTTPSLSSAAECIVQDPGFEAGTPNPNWKESSSNFPTPLCPTYSCTQGYPHSGTWWVWFGGITLQEFAYVQQSVTIPAWEAATLDFYLAIPIANNTGYLRVLIDGDQLFEATEADAASYPDYQKVSLDVSAYADGGNHLLRFESTTYAGDDVTNFWVDDICVTMTTPNGAATAMPWIPLLLLDE